MLILSFLNISAAFLTSAMATCCGVGVGESVLLRVHVPVGVGDSVLDRVHVLLGRPLAWPHHQAAHYRPLNDGLCGLSGTSARRGEGRSIRHAIRVGDYVGARRTSSPCCPIGQWLRFEFQGLPSARWLAPREPTERNTGECLA